MRLTMVMSQIALETSLACKGRGNGNFISLKSWNESFLVSVVYKEDTRYEHAKEAFIYIQQTAHIEISITCFRVVGL